MIPIPVRTAFIAFLEANLNQLLKYDPTSQARAKVLQGKVIQIELKPLQAIWFVFSGRNIDVLGTYEHPADASLTLTVSGLDLLKNPEKLSQFIRENKVDLQGDPALFHAFSHLFKDLNIDWEEQLSTYTGDVIAHMFCRGLSTSKTFLQHQFARTKIDLKEAVTEEWKLAPGPLEVAAFCDDVSDLVKHSEPIFQRVEALLNRRQQ